MTALATRTLGRTGLEVTELGFGAMELRGGSGPEVSEDEAARVLNAVLDHGITFIDTSIDYGLSEERIGRHISDRRDEFYLASKCGCPWAWDGTAPKPPHDFGRDNIVAGVEQSLRRLRTDHLDLLQVHMSPSRAELEEHAVIETLQELQQQGKTRFIGMSGTLPDLPDHIAMGVFDAFQIPYSAVEREHEELLSAAAEAGAGVIVRGGVGKGAARPSARTVHRKPELVDAWERADLGDLLDGMAPMEFLLRFTLAHPALGTTIVGTRNPANLAANVEAARKGPLPADLHEEAKRRLDAVGVRP